MGRIFGQQTVVHVTAWTDVAAPESATPNRGDHRSYHADKRQQTNDGEEPADDDICEDNPIERKPWSCEVTMKLFLFIFHISYLFLNPLQRYDIYDRYMNHFIYLCIGFIY